MKEINEEVQEEEKIIKQNIDELGLIKKLSSESILSSNDDREYKEKLIEIRHSSFYNLKDYLFFFSLMLSSSMNFSYLYFPYIIIGIILQFFIGKNSITSKSIKYLFELSSLIYSTILIIIKIICLLLIYSENTYISENSEFFLNLGICYLRKHNTSFYFIMTFLGEAFVLLFSIYSFIISRKCKIFSKENDTSLMKNSFWTNRYLIILNYIFILSFTVFNVSFLTLFYIFILQILFLLSSIKMNQEILERLTNIIFKILRIFILIQIGLINLFNVPTLQENILHNADIKDGEGNIKVFSIYTKIGINYAYNDKLYYIWKEWIGYLMSILSLITLTFSLNNIRVFELELKKKASHLSLSEAKNLLYEEDEMNDKKNENKKTVKIKRKISKGIIKAKSILEIIIKFITSPAFIIQFCRIVSIFYIYLYPNYYSIGVFITLFFSSIFLDVNKNNKLTLYLLFPSVTLTSFFYHISNINGIFENYSSIRRSKYLNFALGKYKYSFLEYYGHHLFYIFIMFLIYSFCDSNEINNKKKDYIINMDDERKEPLLNNSIEFDTIQEMPEQEESDSIDLDINIQNILTFTNILLKFIFTHIDKITLIAMYYVSMRTINVIHLVLVTIFLIQILFPIKIEKMYKGIICIIQILFFIELFIHILKAYFVETFNDKKSFMNFLLIYTEDISDNNIEPSIYLVLYCFYFQYQFNNFSYLSNIKNNNKINLENYIKKKCQKLPKIKYILFIFGKILSALYMWILIAIFFVTLCYFEINFIFAIKLEYFLFLSFSIIVKILNNEKNSKFSPALHYSFLIFCSINSFLVYLYQFRSNDFIKSIFDGIFNENFFTKNLPNIGFSLYQNNNLYFNFLPYFGLTFISVLFINEINRQYELLNSKFNNEIEESKTLKTFILKKKEIINKLNELEELKKLKEKNFISEDEEILKSDIYQINVKIIKYLKIKYFFVNLIKIIAEFYWLLLFITIGIIFSFYDLSFSMVIYIIIFTIFLIIIFLRRITILTKYINKRKSFFVSKVIRYTFIEKPLSQNENKYYRNKAFKYLLAYNFIFLICLYLYGVFDLFQHGCNKDFFKGCEQSNEPIFEPDGNIENYIKAFTYLFGLYVDIRNEGLIEVAWVHILLSILLGFDVYSQKILNKYTLESKDIKRNILDFTNENNTLYLYDIYRDDNIRIKIGLQLGGLSSSEEAIKKMEERYNEMIKENLEKEEEKKEKNDISKDKKEKEIEKKNEEKEKKQENDELRNEYIIDTKTNKTENNINTINEFVFPIKKDLKENIYEDINKKSIKNNLLKDKNFEEFWKKLFVQSNNNKQILYNTNNNGTKIFWFLKKFFEELIIILLISLALTKLNIFSFIYFIYFAYLTTTKKTMLKFYILYCLLLILIVIQSIIYVSNISEDTSQRPNLNILNILNNKLNIPWYKNDLNIEKKFAFFYGFGVNKTQIGLLLLEYIQVIAINIYLNFFSFSIYQDVKNRGEKELSETKFNFKTIKLNSFDKDYFKHIDKKLLNQYTECLKNFDLDISGDKFTNMFQFKEEPKIDLKMELTNQTYDILIRRKINRFKAEEINKKNGDSFIPDPDYVKDIQEFIFVYLHIFFLFFIIILCIIIPGIISIFYLVICFYYFINSDKIYLGLKYGYPKQIKKLLRICLIFDLIIQLIYQIPFISSNNNNILYKIFNSLGFSKLLNYLDNSDIEFSSSNIIEIIGKPLIYLIISLQTIIYNSTDFKKYYLLFLLQLEDELRENSLANAYIFNNSRIHEFKNSCNLRLRNGINMEKIRTKVEEWSNIFENERENIFKGPVLEPLKYIKEKGKKKEEEKKDEESGVKEEKKTQKNIEIKKEEQRQDNDNQNDEKKNEEKEEKKSKECYDIKEEKIKSKGVSELIKIQRKRNIISKNEIIERLTNILLNGIIMKFYLWFNKNSIFFKAMNFHRRLNFVIESFIGTIITRSYIQNNILDTLKMLDFSNFDEDEVEILEDFFNKFKNGKLDKELEKIKSEIEKKKIKIIDNSNIENKIDEININNDNNIINEDIIINDIKEKKIIKEPEYIIQKRKKEININTIKFKQFFYLLDTKLFKFELSNSFLIKKILSNLTSFIAKNFDKFIYLIMLINHMINCSILSLFYPISIFCFALLENPRPKQIYWKICLYYTILILSVKFIFQLKIFSFIMNNKQYSEFIQTLYNYKIGIRYYETGFGYEFFKYISLDSFILLLLSLYRNILISSGLWNRREEQIENIFLASERFEIFRDLPSINEDDQNKVYRFSNYYYKYYIFERILKDKKLKENLEKSIIKNKEKFVTSDNKKSDLIDEKEEKEGKEEEENSGDDLNKIINRNINVMKKLFYYDKLRFLTKYDEANKNYFQKLFPKTRNEKPGIDYYPFIALSLAIIIIYILLFFTQMVQDKTFGPVDLNTTQFSGNMVLFLILHISILVYDRILYVSQNKTELKFKYFIFQRNKYGVGLKISKKEYNDIKSGYWLDKGKPYHFSPKLIGVLRYNNCNLFYIQTEKFNSPLLQKYILHLVTTFISHILAFFYFPMTGNNNLLNTVYCNDEGSDLCNDFTKNTFIIIFYILYIIYLYVSSLQIRYGYYDIRRKSLFKKDSKITYYIYKIFNHIPFLPQLRNIIDWTCTSTCFDLFQWIKFESIYDSIFNAYAKEDKEDDNPTGKIVEKKKKIGCGGTLSFILIFIIILPLILFSSLNPTNKLNNLTKGKLNVDLAFVYENDVELNYNLFENARAKTINNMFKNGDSDWKKYKYDKSVQTRNFKHEQIQIIKFSETSDKNWDLAKPHINELIELLNITNNKDLQSIKLNIQVEFERALPAEAQTVIYNADVIIFDISKDDPITSEGAKKIYDLRNALENCSDINIEFEEGYLSPLRLTSGNKVTAIEDKTYIKKKNLQLGFQGCIKEQLIINDIKKDVNVYLNSYFTFKSKDPEEKDYTGAEFHPFNDLISEATLGYSILTFYLTFVLVIGTYVADFLSSDPSKVMLEDLPHPKAIIDLCEGIKIERYSYNFKEEERLYNVLIELIRSPDYLKMYTQSSLQNFTKRNQKLQENENNEDDGENNDKNEKNKIIKDTDDEDDSYYEDCDDEEEKEKNKDKDKEEKKEEKDKENENESNNNINNIDDEEEKKEVENNKK